MFTFPEIAVRQPPPADKMSAAVSGKVSVPAARISPLDPRIETWVLTHKAKRSVTVETLTTMGIPHKVFSNPDWGWPAGHPELQTDRTQRPSVREYALRQFRAFRGHQTILASAAPDKLTLVFEDDASLAADTTPAEVIQHLNAAIGFVTDMPYDAVSFHAREQSPPKRPIALYGREYVELGLITQTGWGHQFFLQPVAATYGGQYADHLYRWHEGCLAYLIGPAGRDKWRAAGHGNGMPCDLFLANELNTIVMRRTIFLHDQTYGSLISNTTPQKTN